MAFPPRRRKSAAERREQYKRAEGRMTQHLLSKFFALSSHRGNRLSRFSEALCRALSESAFPTRDHFTPEDETPVGSWKCQCGMVNWDWRELCHVCSNARPDVSSGGDGTPEPADSAGGAAAVEPCELLPWVFPLSVKASTFDEAPNLGNTVPAVQIGFSTSAETANTPEGCPLDLGVDLALILGLGLIPVPVVFLPHPLSFFAPTWGGGV